MEELLKNLRDRNPGSVDRRLHAIKEVGEKWEEFRPDQWEELSLTLHTLLSELSPIPTTTPHTPHQQLGQETLLRITLLSTLINISLKSIPTTSTPTTPTTPTNPLTLNNAFIQSLATWSLERSPLPGEVEELYLHLLDLLTSGITIPFKASFLPSLISNALHVLRRSFPPPPRPLLIPGSALTAPPPPSPPNNTTSSTTTTPTLTFTPGFTSALAILTHLVESSPIVIRSIQQLHDYKRIWSAICNMFANVTSKSLPPSSPTTTGTTPTPPPPLSPSQIRAHILLIRLILGMDVTGEGTLLEYSISHASLLADSLLTPGAGGAGVTGTGMDQALLLQEMAALIQRLLKSLEWIVGVEGINASLIRGGSGHGSGGGGTAAHSISTASTIVLSNNRATEKMKPVLGEEHFDLLTTYLRLVKRMIANLFLSGREIVQKQGSTPSVSSSAIAATATGVGVVGGILSLISSFTPLPPSVGESAPSSNITDYILINHFEQLFLILEGLKEEGPEGACHLIHSTHLRLFTILSAHPSVWGKKGVVEPLSKLVGELRFLPSPSPTGAMIGENTVSARLLSLAFKASSLRETVLQKILSSAAGIQGLLDGLVHVPQGSLDVAWCVVEVLGLLGDNSRNKSILDLLLSALNSGGAASHLAFALRSTSLPLVTRALSITATVAFSRDNIKELSEALVKVNSGSSLPLSLDPPPLPLSLSATLALSVIQKELEKAGEKDEKQGVALDCLDVMTLYQDRMELMELQMTQLKDQLSQTNLMNKKLSELLSKNGRVMGMQLAELDVKEVTVKALKGDVAKLTQTVNQQEGVAAEATRSLRSSLLFKEKKLAETLGIMRSLETRIGVLEAEKNTLMKKVEVESAGRKKQGSELIELRQGLEKKDESLKEEMKKVIRLEKELVAAGEEHKRMEHLLAKEKQTVDVIRGILVRNGSEHV